MLTTILLEATPKISENTDSPMLIVITSIITLVSTLGVAYIVNVMSKKANNEKDIKIATINSEKDKKELDDLTKELKEALDSIKALKEELEKEKDSRISIENKFEAVKIAFRIIFNQYEKLFKDDTDQLGMLEELKQIIEK